MTVIPFPKSPALEEDERRRAFVMQMVIDVFKTDAFLLGVNASDPRVCGHAMATGLLSASWAVYAAHVQGADIAQMMIDEIHRIAKGQADLKST